ncbi:GNAT family N-acetyltransferase [Streptomyces sp. NBC_01716]|uniref:GNAT family N-acetyltransferase n=1 Tax=Streptomyces sp. NBC_01716 TaxID=2975917 RepID=UPI002E30DD6E|nr:GNAT family N-acetyltransferase [Streptomyces sp. NBC_01716]
MNDELPAALAAEGGLVLRPWRATDVTRLHEACQDEEIQRWTTVPVPYTRESAVAFVGIADAGWKQRSSALFCVTDANGDLLGATGLVELDLAQATGEVGYWTAQWARGRGVAASSTRALARWAFDELGLLRIVWAAELGNERSRRVALGVGFGFEGVAPDRLPMRDGSRTDAWVGTLLPRDLIRLKENP